MEKNMKIRYKNEILKVICICFAAFIMALNIKSFVRTGGLYPGGATGLALLIQRISEMFFGISASIYSDQYPAECRAGISGISFYRQEIYPVLLSYDPADRIFYGYYPRLRDYI